MLVQVASHCIKHLLCSLYERNVLKAQVAWDDQGYPIFGSH